MFFLFTAYHDDNFCFVLGIYVLYVDEAALLLQCYHVEKWKSDIEVVVSNLQSAVDQML